MFIQLWELIFVEEKRNIFAKCGLLVSNMDKPRNFNSWVCSFWPNQHFFRMKQSTNHQKWILWIVKHLSFTQQITSSFPSHPANSFYYPRLKHLPPMARVLLTKTKNNQIFSLPIHPTQSNQIPVGNEIDASLISKLGTSLQHELLYEYVKLWHRRKIAKVFSCMQK